MNNSKDNPLNWYAVYTKSRAEKKVNNSLLKKGIHCYLPLVTTIRQWSDRKKKVQVPLIPSFVFVRASLGDFNAILNTEHVLHILKYLGKPAIIKEYEIENLKILLQDTDNITFSEAVEYEKGDSVLVEKGIFKGLVAECVQLNGRHRIILRIDGIENIIEINIPLSYVKKISDNYLLSN